MRSSAEKMNFVLEPEVSRELRSLVPRGHRSEVVNEAIRKELLDLRRKRATEKLRKVRGRTPGMSSREIVETLRKDRTRG